MFARNSLLAFKIVLANWKLTGIQFFPQIFLKFVCVIDEKMWTELNQAVGDESKQVSFCLHLHDACIMHDCIFCNRTQIISIYFEYFHLW